MKAAPVVSAVAILSLALGIGANTAMFSILDSLLLRSLPVKDPQRLVMVGQLPNGRTSWTNPIWEAIRDRPELFERGHRLVEHALQPRAGRADRVRRRRLDDRTLLRGARRPGHPRPHVDEQTMTGAAADPMVRSR